MKTVSIRPLSKRSLFTELLANAELTFIICTKAPDAHSSELPHSALTMIGDVNLFLKGSRDDPDDEFEVEVEIMIAGEVLIDLYPYSTSMTRSTGRANISQARFCSDCAAHDVVVRNASRLTLSTTGAKRQICGAHRREE